MEVTKNWRLPPTAYALLPQVGSPQTLRHARASTAAMHAALSLSAAAAGTSGRQQLDWHLPRQPALNSMQQQRLTAPAAAAVVAGGAPRRWVAARAAAAAADRVAARAADEWVEVGRVGPPHGVRGEMKVQPLTDFPEDRLGEPGARWVPGQRAAAPCGSPAAGTLLGGQRCAAQGGACMLVGEAHISAAAAC